MRANKVAGEAAGPRPGPSAGDVLRYATGFGLLTGFGEVVIRLVQRFALDDRIWLGRSVVWMAPLADLLLFLAVGGVLIAAGLHRRLGWPGLALPFVALGLAGPIVAYPRLHPVALWLFVLGLAVVLTRVTASLWRVLFTRRFLALLGGLWVAVLVAERAQAALAERAALANLPDASADASNVILLVWDTVRAADLSLLGYDRPTTPVLEGLEGSVVFTQAWATSPWTLPSHASLLTGAYPHETPADWLVPLPEDARTLSEVLADRGYVTAGFVGNLIYATYETGLDQGFSRYEDYPISWAAVANSAWVPRRIVRTVTGWMGRQRLLVTKQAGDINRSFFDWLDANPDRPFFAFLNLMDAHAPYVPPDSLYRRFGEIRGWRAPADLSEEGPWSTEQVASERAAYDAAIAYLDQELGDLVRRLRERGVLDRTLIVLVSDHGEQFGEHGLYDHGNSLFRPSLHVPLVLRVPGATGVRRIDRPVSIRDVPATIMDFLAVSRHPFPGHSLLEEPGAGPSPVLSAVSQGIRMDPEFPAARGDLQSIVGLGHHLIRSESGATALYALTDSAEANDLAGSPAHRDILRELREGLPRQ